MKRAVILSVLFLSLITGCASVKVIPEPVPDGSINLKDNSQTISRDNLLITIAPAETDMVNYNIEGIVASFNVTIQNESKSVLTFTQDSFVLIDSNKTQYYPLTPEKVRAMMAKDTYYLLPYPYVGFYYLEDYERAQYINSTSSNLPYYFELYPQELFTKALPVDPVIPKAGINGRIYFHTDLHSLSSFSINVYKSGTAKSAQPDYIFPFKVVK